MQLTSAGEELFNVTGDNTLEFRQSWPTRMDMHQDIEDSLASSSISHAGGPQSPARSTENLLNGHRSKGLLELGRREESGDPGQPAQGASAAASGPAAGSGSGPLKAPAPSTSTAAKQRTCLFRVEEDEEEEEEQDPSPLPTQVILRRKPPSITNRLTSRKSAPVLNQIFEEEGESEDDFDTDEGLPPKLSRLKMNMAGNPAAAANAASLPPAAGSASSSPGSATKRYHRRKSQGRGSSCSSSETSDDDSESHRRRLDKDAALSHGWNRRDSSEGPPGSSGGNGGGGGSSSSGQGKPPGEGGGSSGPDRGGSPPGGDGNGGGGDGGGGGSSSSKGQGSPSTCCHSSSVSAASRSSRTASRGAELVESLKLMSLCLSSQLQQHRGGRAGRGGRLLIDPRGLSAGGVKTHEKPAWKMCLGSNGSLDTITLPTTALPRTHTSHHHHTHSHTRKAAGSPGLRAGPGGRDRNAGLSALKNGVLQLPLCEKTISVNIQHGGGSRDGLLCTSAPPSCCQVI